MLKEKEKIKITYTWIDLSYNRMDVSYVGEHTATDPYISPIYGDLHRFYDNLAIYERLEINEKRFINNRLDNIRG